MGNLREVIETGPEAENILVAVNNYGYPSLQASQTIKDKKDANVNWKIQFSL